MKTTVAIVVTYNRRELLLQCIEHILNQKNVTTDILIIDNNSSDGTYEMLLPYITNRSLLYFNTGANLGGAGGFNYGIRKAVELGYDYLWIMDDDCMPRDNSLCNLIEAGNSLNDNFGFLSSKVLWTDGSICCMNVQRRTVTKNVKNFSESMIPVAMASFVSLFIRADVVKEVGLPIKDFFIWTDDWEYTRRISRKYKSYIVTNSIVDHHSKKNIKADISAESEDRLDRFNYMYRNDVYLYRREGLTGFLYEVARLSFHIIKVVFCSKDSKIKRIKTIIRGTKNGFSFNPEIEFVNRK